MPQPHTSIRIWFSPRTGSTLLCKGLEQTGIAGVPGEYFNISQGDTFKDHYQISDFEELKTKLWSLGSSPNGVFAIKQPRHHSDYQRWLAEFRQLKGLPADAPEAGLMDELFPNSVHIFLSRRNKVRQAVSWWKAIQDNQWHLTQRDERAQEADFYADKYNYDALTHLWKESQLIEANIDQYFQQNQIKPLTIMYEDMIRDYEATIYRVLDFAGLDRSGIEIAPMYYRQSANELNETWVQRFRQEIQAGWGERYPW
ncbi:MAG: Stf0 family sulfotransferase [Bacteroidota bacterium]